MSRLVALADKSRVLRRHQMTGIADCRARAASDQALAAPTSENEFASPHCGLQQENASSGIGLDGQFAPHDIDPNPSASGNSRRFWRTATISGRPN
jgi:hypothetical protein